VARRGLGDCRGGPSRPRTLLVARRGLGDSCGGPLRPGGLPWWDGEPVEAQWRGEPVEAWNSRGGPSRPGTLVVARRGLGGLSWGSRGGTESPSRPGTLLVFSRFPCCAHLCDVRQSGQTDVSWPHQLHLSTRNVRSAWYKMCCKESWTKRETGNGKKRAEMPRRPGACNDRHEGETRRGGIESGGTEGPSSLGTLPT
jgi:hypothetical protein